MPIVLFELYLSPSQIFPIGLDPYCLLDIFALKSQYLKLRVAKVDHMNFSKSGPFKIPFFYG